MLPIPLVAPIATLANNDSNNTHVLAAIVLMSTNTITNPPQSIQITTTTTTTHTRTTVTKTLIGSFDYRNNHGGGGDGRTLASGASNEHTPASNSSNNIATSTPDKSTSNTHTQHAQPQPEIATDTHSHTVVMSSACSSITQYRHTNPNYWVFAKFMQKMHRRLEKIFGRTVVKNAWMGRHRCKRCVVRAAAPPPAVVASAPDQISQDPASSTQPLINFSAPLKQQFAWNTWGKTLMNTLMDRYMIKDDDMKWQMVGWMKNYDEPSRPRGWKEAQKHGRCRSDSRSSRINNGKCSSSSSSSGSSSSSSSGSSGSSESSSTNKNNIGGVENVADDEYDWQAYDEYEERSRSTDNHDNIDDDDDDDGDDEYDTVDESQVTHKLNHDEFGDEYEERCLLEVGICNVIKSLTRISNVRLVDWRYIEEADSNKRRYAHVALSNSRRSCVNDVAQNADEECRKRLKVCSDDGK